MNQRSGITNTTIMMKKSPHSAAQQERRQRQEQEAQADIRAMLQEDTSMDVITTLFPVQQVQRVQEQMKREQDQQQQHELQKQAQALMDAADAEMMEPLEEDGDPIPDDDTKTKTKTTNSRTEDAMNELQRNYDRLVQEHETLRLEHKKKKHHTHPDTTTTAATSSRIDIYSHPMVLQLKQRIRQLERQYDQDISTLQQAMKRMELERQTALEALEQHGIAIATPTTSSESTNDNEPNMTTPQDSPDSHESTKRRNHPWDRDGGRRHHQALTQAEQQFRTAMAKLHAMDGSTETDPVDGNTNETTQDEGHASTSTTNSNLTVLQELTTTLPFIPVAALLPPSSQEKGLLTLSWKNQFRSSMSQLHAQKDSSSQQRFQEPRKQPPQPEQATAATTVPMDESAANKSDKDTVPLEGAPNQPIMTTEPVDIPSSEPTMSPLDKWKGEFRSAMDELHAVEEGDATPSRGIYAALSALQTVNQSLLEQNALLASELKEERENAAQDERVLSAEREEAIQARHDAERTMEEMVQRLKVVHAAVSQQEEEAEQVRGQLQQAMDAKQQLEATISTMESFQKQQQQQQQQQPVEQSAASLPKDTSQEPASRDQPQKSVEELQELLSKEQTEKSALAVENEDLKSVLVQREELVAQCTELIEKLQDDLAQVQAEQAEFLQSKEELQSSKHELEQRISMLEETAESLDVQHKSALEEKGLLEKQLAQAAERIEALETRDAVETPHNDRSTNDAEATNTSREGFVALEEENRALKLERDQLQEKLRKTTRTQHGEGLGSVETQALTATLQRLQHELKEAKAEKARLEERSKEDPSIENSIEGGGEQKLSSMAAPPEQTSRSIPQLEANATHSEHKRMLLQKNPTTATSENAALKQRVRDLQEHLKATMATRDAVESSLNASVATVDAIRETLSIVQASTESKCDRLRREKKEADRRILQLESSAADSEDLMRTATSIMRSMKSDGATLRRLQKELKQALNDKSVVEDKLLQAEAQLKELETAYESKSPIMMAQNQGETMTAPKQEKDALEATIVSLQNELAEAVRARDALADKLTQLEKHAQPGSATHNEAKIKQNAALFEAITTRDKLVMKLEETETKLKEQEKLAGLAVEHDTKAKEKDALIYELKARLAEQDSNHNDDDLDGSMNSVYEGIVESLLEEKQKLSEKVNYIEGHLRERELRMSKMEVQLVLLRANQGMGEALPAEKQALGPMLKDLEKSLNERDVRIVLLEDQLALANLRAKRKALQALLPDDKADAIIVAPPTRGTPRRAMSTQPQKRSFRGLNMSESEGSRRSLGVTPEEPAAPARKNAGSAPKRTRSRISSVRHTLSGGFTGWKKKTDRE